MQNKLAITISDRFERRIDRLFDQIDEAVDQLNWAFVRDRAQTVLTLDPDNADALRFLASSDRALGGLTQAAAIHSLSPPPIVLARELAPGQPVSFANGRYEVKQFLGEGDKKKVWPTTPYWTAKSLSR